MRRALTEELRADATIATRAENLVAIAEQYSVTIEELIGWIHYHAPGKQWTSAEFRRWCIKLCEARSDLAALQKPSDWHRICPKCYEQIAHRLSERWICVHCGEVQ